MKGDGAGGGISVGRREGECGARMAGMEGGRVGE